MSVNTYTADGSNSGSYADALKEIAGSAKDLIHNEIDLIKTEAVTRMKKVSKHSAQAAIFGGLLATSILPFVAFLVLGLGELLGDRYWLSSLIVALVFAVAGGFLAYRAFKKITGEDLQMPATRNSLEREKVTLQSKMQELKDAASGRTI